MDFATQRFLALAKKIHEDLVLLRQVCQQTAKAISDAAETADKDENPTPEIRAILNTLQGIQNNQRAANTSQHQYQNRNLTVAWAGVVAVVLYTTVAYFQLVDLNQSIGISQIIARQSRLQAIAAKLAANETKRAVDVAIEAERPWIGSEGAQITQAPGNVFDAKAYFANTGKTPARITHVAFHGQVYAKFPKNPDYPHTDDPFNQISRSIMVPGKSSSVGPSIAVDPKDLPDVQSGKKKIYFYGIVDYEDMRTNKAHHTKMCWFYAGNSTASLCPSYNDAD